MPYANSGITCEKQTRRFRTFQNLDGLLQTITYHVYCMWLCVFL
jgi:hypothetical protein